MELITRGLVVNDEIEVREVPWHSMQEWTEVYENAYSDNLADKKLALETMQVWKARMSTLPYAVDCTYNLLKVLIRDVEMCMNKSRDHKAVLLDEEDLCMIYSTTITRFLSQVLTVDPKKNQVDSMFKLAGRLNIPQWMVRLRHDSSHGTELPPLQTLREAAHYALQWLDERYWMQEGENIQDYVPSVLTKPHSASIASLVDTRQSVFLFMRMGYYNASHIPEKSLRRTLQYMKEDFLKDNPDYAYTQKRRWKLNHAMSHIDKTLFSLVNDDRCAKELLDIMIESGGFMIDEEVLEIYKVTWQEGDLIQKLPKDLVNQWTDMLGILHCAQLIPKLMESLVEKCCSLDAESFSCNIAALWLNETARAILKLRQLQDVLVEKGITLKEKVNLRKHAEYRLRLLKHDLTANEIQLGFMESEAIKQVQKQDPQLLSAISLPATVVAPTPDKFIDLVKKLFLQASTWSTVYAESMLSLLGSIISPDNRLKLLKLTKIYLGDLSSLPKTCNGSSQKVYTLSEVLENSEEHRYNGNRCEVVEPGLWVPYSHVGGTWHGCALGRLPWQSKVSVADLMLPMDWVYEEEESMDCSM